MILVDFSNLVINALFSEKDAVKYLNENYARFKTFRTLGYIRNKFFNKYGEVVICCDSRKTWREEIYPHYKFKRKKERKESGIDWAKIFDMVELVKKDLKENFPYKVIEQDGMEADDVIFSLCLWSYSNPKFDIKNVIISNDEDLIQLQGFHNVSQYSNKSKDFLTCEDVSYFLFKKICKGDSGDSIPNILSPDDCFVTGTKQKKSYEKHIIEWYNNNKCVPKEYLERYYMNDILINLDNVPEKYYDLCIESFLEYDTRNRSKVVDFFVNNDLEDLLEHAQEF